MFNGPEGAGYDYTVKQIAAAENIVMKHVGDGPIERANARVPGAFGASEDMHNGRLSVFLRDWRERKDETAQVAENLQRELSQLPGVRVSAQVTGGLVRTRGQPMQIVLGGPDYAQLAQWRDRLLERIEKNPGLTGADSDYKETRPQMRVQIDHQRAADLGVSVSAIGSTLESMMGSRRITTFVREVVASSAPST